MSATLKSAKPLKLRSGRCATPSPMPGRREGLRLIELAFIAFDLTPREARRCARVIAARPKGARLFAAGLALTLMAKGR